MYQKDFGQWHSVKSELSEREDFPKFNERDIWWCSIGVNIGHESDGKGRLGQDDFLHISNHLKSYLP